MDSETPRADDGRGRAGSAGEEPAEASPVQRAIAAARERLVQAVRPNPEQWRALVDRALADALRAGDADGFAETIQFITFLFDAEGRFDEAVAEIEYAATVARRSPTATGFLEAQRAAMLSAQGDRGAALEAVERSEELLAAAGAAAGVKWPVLLETVRLKLLLEPSPRLPDLLALGSSPERQIDYSFLLSWYIPYLAARGDRKDARPLIQLARAAATAAQHHWRISDAESFEIWLDGTGGKLLHAPPKSPVSTVAALRESSLWLWAAALRRDLGSLPRALNAMARAFRSRGASDHGGLEPWKALARLLAGDRSLVPGLHPPAETTLLNVGTWLAAATAVAVAGARDHAGVWLHWVRELGERGVESSLEWPISRRRVEALLLLRTGQTARALTEMQGAAAWAAENGYRTEEAIASLQAAEISALTSQPRRRATTNREASALDFLVSRGIDPWPHTAIVESGALEGQGRRPSLLTARELDILRHLAEGLTYKESAQMLGISWQTVRTVAYRIYQKLGVSSKHAAAQEGKRLGLI